SETGMVDTRPNSGRSEGRPRRPRPHRGVVVDRDSLIGSARDRLEYPKLLEVLGAFAASKPGR
ncbi:MAG: hypothetical protein KDC38_21320, partial [Planctomycetes bacterium]|nr:hypothetical protein [Planctomycetota bacterium]